MRFQYRIGLSLGLQWPPPVLLANSAGEICASKNTGDQAEGCTVEDVKIFVRRDQDGQG